VPKDQRVLVGIVRPGEPITISAKLEYGKGRAPEPAGASAVPRTAGLTVRSAEAVPDGQYLVFNVVLEPRADLRSGLVYESIELRASGFTTTLHVIGRVP
jgi:hypothetical protein